MVKSSRISPTGTVQRGAILQYCGLERGEISMGWKLYGRWLLGGGTVKGGRGKWEEEVSR